MQYRDSGSPEVVIKIGGDVGEQKPIKTEEKKKMPGDNKSHKDAIKHIKMAQDVLKQDSEENVIDVDEVLTMAIDMLSNGGSIQDRKDDEMIEGMKKTKSKKLDFSDSEEKE